ncbi:ketosteroid isomerase-like protein [Agromyces flavus]|uniref:Ketosteroid isomerase-like protein n=1 Tax=Agromyces flavus TaxID=589382 RepID=A0A1H1VYN5_9MICO|nr:nuclear transport factor 2 family protein [Agromyces flavus]MCP2366043.1 ketosteroid isomerase-like protein [Agromyces flavus]SDS89873.1 SnoaL-like domain-containing protein [Agromyces flavus]
MSERDEFLAWVQGDLVNAERAMMSGDDNPRRAIWSRVPPVSVLGAWKNAVGREELIEAFEVLAGSFSDCTDWNLELISYDVVGDMAYTVGFERMTASIDGRPRTFTLRATQVYRKEDGDWRVVHRHADAVSRPGAVEPAQP